MSLKSTFSSKTGLYANLIIGFVLVLSFYFLSSGLNNFNQESQQVEKFQNRFDRNSELLKKMGDRISEILNPLPSNYWPLLERAVESKGFLLQIYRNDTLIFWNNQMISNDVHLLNQSNKDTVIQQGTGWFMLHRVIEPPYKLFLLKQIRAEYDVNNSYLPSRFTKDFGSTTSFKLTTDFTRAEYSLKNSEGNDCLGIQFDSERHSTTSSLLLLLALYILIYISIILIINKLYDLFNKHIENKTVALLFFIVDLIILRFLDVYFKIPEILKQSFLFMPEGNEISGLTTIGDLLLNSILLLAIAIKLISITPKKILSKKIGTNFHSLGNLLLLSFISYLIYLSMYLTASNLEYHSLLGIQVDNLNGYLALLVVMILNTTLFIFVVAFQRVLKRKAFSIVYIILGLILTGVVTFVFVDSSQLVSLVSITLVLISILILNYPSEKQDVRIIKFIFLAIIFSVSASLIINKAEHDSRDNHQNKMVHLFSNPNDFDLEENFRKNYSTIVNDDQVLAIVDNSEFPEDDLYTYLVSNYFRDYASKYTIQLTICEENSLLELQPDGIIIGCNDYFTDLIEQAQNSNDKFSLFILERRPDRINYLGKLQLNSTTIPERNLNIYIQFLFTYVPEGLGYPELLVDSKLVELDLTGYSYAIYKENQLDYKFGSFAYNTSYSFLEGYPNNEFFDLSAYRHIKIEFEPNHFVILSRPVAKISEQLVTFSVLFLCFVCITFITLIVVFRRKLYDQLGLSFRNRLQILFVTTISVVIALMAIITLFYVESNNENKIQEQLNEKTYSVIIELEHKLGGIGSLAELDQEYLHNMLRKFSLVFFSDINLYNANGQVIASSRPEIFNKGLLSENINPMAFEELIVKNKLFYTTRESIGTASYYSSYAPFYLESGSLAGIVNLPYFARQSEVRQAYYQMLFTFINLFVIFGIIGAFVALFLSRIMAKPLYLLQQSIGNLRIDKENERIEWDREDEIGQLIAEYNRMVDKLEQSAELLKHSERESAWREVAQQIAHEIKNPLTPMKLNVQYLEKAYNSKDPGFETKMKNISASLITQIDSLDKVAEMFSDFAKSNAGNFDKVNLVNLINSSVLLFTSHSKIKFKVKIENEKTDYFTPAVEKDLLRVFNNLIKNALQAIDVKTGGEVEINIRKQSSYNIVQISDNGRGIPASVRANIFQPYFTTKSGGTGLGLAIVKNIITEIGGEISFESDENKGTMFTLKFKEF
jgi:signal transduction histidine kinase